MKSNILPTIKSLAATSSRLAKEEILKKNLNNLTLKRFFFLALDPYTQFHQRKIPAYIQSKEKISLDHAMDRLVVLSRREKTGNAAIDFLSRLLGQLSDDDARVLERIIAKDPDCGVQASTLNKIWENLIPEYPCMLCSGYEEKVVQKIIYPAFVQLKMDGMRFNAIVEGGNVEFRSRNGKELNILNPLFAEVFLQMSRNIGLGDVVFDGELIVADDFGKPLDRKTGNGILNKALKGTITQEESAQIRATVWDVIPLNAFRQGYCPVEYDIRLATVATAIEKLPSALSFQALVSVVDTTIVNSLDEAKDVFQKYYSAGLEGIILKDRRGSWENKRTKSQVKFKGELECDLVCVGWEEGTGKNIGKLGALVLQSSDAKVNVSVGTGLTDENRSTLTEQNIVGKIISVKYNARISNKSGEDSLFLPVFIEVREDKTEADSSVNIK